jgi:hypothetical protein
MIDFTNCKQHALYICGMSRYGKELLSKVTNEKYRYIVDKYEFSGVPFNSQSSTIGLFMDMRIHKQGKIYLIQNDILQILMYDNILATCLSWSIINFPWYYGNYYHMIITSRLHEMYSRLQLIICSHLKNLLFAPKPTEWL